MMKLNWLIPFICILTVTCTPTKTTVKPNPDAGGANPTTEVSPPKLVVMISIDQMRQDYFDRFAPHFKGGLKQIWENGLVFTDAHHPHAITATGPGHATLSTGSYPSNHGIVNNEYFDQNAKQWRYCARDENSKIIGVENDGSLEGVSPRNLQRGTLGDWMKKANSKSKVFAVAFKDRSSALMAGKRANRAFWFDNLSTKMVSSDYYKGDYPEWGNALVGKDLYKAQIEKGWHKKLGDDAYSTCRADEFKYEKATFQSVFPHTVESLPAQAKRFEQRIPSIMLWSTPYGDAFALDFAKEIIKNESLGKDDNPDILFVGCSTADAIGHHFGPYSQEVQDYYLHLDEYLASFFKYLDENIGKDNYVIALSADHGVVMMPEEAAARGDKEAKRVAKDHFEKITEAVGAELQKELQLEQPLILTTGFAGISLNYLEAESKGISPKELRSKVAEAFKNVDFIEDVFTPEDMKGNSSKPYIESFRNSDHKDRGVEIKFRYPENYLVNYNQTGSSHGSPYSYDSHVPVIFMGKGIKSGKKTNKVYTTDVAPTLAKILNIKPTNKIDGKIIIE